MQIQHIDSLSGAGAKKLLLQVIHGLQDNTLQQTDEDTIKYLLESLIYVLDDLDNDDTFGTEGWRHTFGIED